MRSRLPRNLNPRFFDDTLHPYCDDYEDRYSLDYKGRGFLIENRTPFTVHLCEGFTGKELSERRWLVNLLRVASYIQKQTGQWPDLTTEWAEMCPGGAVKVNVTPLAAMLVSEPQLPDVLETVNSRIDKALDTPDAEFSEAERHYHEELESLVAFGKDMLTAQREFDEEPLRTLNTNTKTRRLRFVAVIARFARSPSTETRLSASLLEWASQHLSELRCHADSKGAILASTGRASAVPYLKVAKELGVIAPVGRGLALTNSGLALALLPASAELFSLKMEERLFFLFELLLRDIDYICPLLIVLTMDFQTKAQLRTRFAEAYTEHVRSLLCHCGTRRSRNLLESALDRIARWRRAAVYMEHIVDPRLSWLVDLELCEMRGDSIRATEGGVRLAKAFEDHQEGSALPITKSFLRNRFFKSIGRILRHPSADHRQGPVPSEELASLLKPICLFIQRNTQSLAPNRIVASSLFRYAGIVLFTQNRIAADFSDMAAFFSNEETARLCGWQLRWQTAQDDGYLSPTPKSLEA